MKILQKKLNHYRHLLFIDLEGTQLSHELIAFGVIKATLNADGTILRSYKGLKKYVIAHNPIGHIVTKLTGIKQETLNNEGISYQKALLAIKNYCGNQFKKMKFITFGNHDLRILNQSLIYNVEADEDIVKQINKNHIDLSLMISQYIKDEKNNPLSLVNNLKVFSLPFNGTHHDPLNDAFNLMALYKSCFSQKDVIYESYLKVLHQMKHLPKPIDVILNKLLSGEDVSSDQFQKLVKDSI